MESMRGRGRGRRGRGRGRGAARGKKTVERKQEPLPVEEADEEPTVEATPIESTIESHNAAQVIPPLDMEADISQLEAPTFTTISRGPSEPMLRLRWGHPVNLIGEKVLNPMIHCCDTCLRPVFIYGRMIPCKHVFCLACAQRDCKQCPRCHDKVVRVEQTGLGTVFMCTHGGTRYGNNGCRRTYLSQRDLQAHINHRHVAGPPLANQLPAQANKLPEKTDIRLPAANVGAPTFYEVPKVKLFDEGDMSYQPARVMAEAPPPCVVPAMVRLPPPRPGNLITVPIQEPPPEPYFNVFNPPPVVTHGPLPIPPPTQPPPYYAPYDYPPPPTDTSIPPPNQWPGNPPYYG